jgi:hypothetical protein
MKVEEYVSTLADALEVTTARELRDRILSLAVLYPQPCASVIRRMLQGTAGEWEFGKYCAAIGIVYARHVFDGLSPRQWDRVEEAARASVKDLNEGECLLLLRELHSRFAGESTGWDSDDASLSDPFEFLRGLEATEIAELLSSEHAAKVALIGAYWPLENLLSLVSSTAAAFRKQIVLNHSRLERLPELALRREATRFAQSLRSGVERRKRATTKQVAAAVEQLARAAGEKKEQMERELSAVKASLEQVKAKEAEQKEARRRECLRVLSEIDFEREKEILSYLKTAQPELARRLSRLLSSGALEARLDALKLALGRSGPC